MVTRRATYAMGARANAFLDGVRLRCPACRTGRMSPGRFSLMRLHERCPTCDIPFVPGRGESVGGVEAAVYLTALVGSLVAMVMVFARAPTWALVAWVLAAGVAMPLLTYRNFRGAWVGAMYAASAWPAGGDPPRATPPTWPWDE